MRKLFKKSMALLLTGAMAITGAVYTGPKATKTAQAAATFHAYTSFQFNNTWAARDICVNPKQGLVGGADYTVKDVGETGYNPTYNYTKQYLVFNGLVDKSKRVVDAGIKDATIDKNGTYTMEFTNFDTSWLPHIGTLTNGKTGDKYKDTDGNETSLTEDTMWNMLAISTDIPTSAKGVTCTNVKVYLDGETTPFAQLAKAPHNTQEGDAKYAAAGNNGYAYAFYIFDTYAENHGTSSCLKNSEAKYKRFPKKSLKIEFTINGLTADTKPVPQYNGLMSGQKFTSGDIVYKVVNQSKDDGTKGTVAVAGVASTSKKTSLTIATTVENGGNKYTVTSIGSKAFQNNKKLKKVKLSSTVKSIGSSAFKKCTKLTSITFNKNVTSIGTSVFEGCSKLAKITLGKKVKSIKKSAFKNCKKLSKISVYQKVKVTKGAFKGCKKTIKVSGKKSYKTYTVKQIKKSGYKKVK